MIVNEAAIIFFAIIVAYLFWSIPTAFVISTRIRRVDIRSVGYGNMGARNTFHEIGPKFGVMVAIIDFSKGALSVSLAYFLGLNLVWQMIAGRLAILGHDFPILPSSEEVKGPLLHLGRCSYYFLCQLLLV